MTFVDIKTKRSCYNGFENNFKRLIKSKEDVNIVIIRVSSTLNEELKHIEYSENLFNNSFKVHISMKYEWSIKNVF